MFVAIDLEAFLFSKTISSHNIDVLPIVLQSWLGISRNPQLQFYIIFSLELTFISFFLQMMKQELADHKPQLEKLNKTGSALARLVGEDEAGQITEAMAADNTRYKKMKEFLKDRSNTLEEALNSSAEVSCLLSYMQA
jgi:hypothetical protein